jgi:ParB family chromosome partitioning protein
VRREWVTALIGRKTLPKDHLVFLAESLTRHVQALTEYRADNCVAAFLGRKDNTMFRRGDSADLVVDNPTKAAHVALAVALSAREARTVDEHSWRSVNPLVKDYLLTLEAWGYHLSDVERLAAGYPEHH